MRKLFHLLVILSLSIIPLQAKTVDYESLDKYIEEYNEKFENSGLIVAILKDGETVFMKSYGYADINTETKILIGVISLVTGISSLIIFGYLWPTIGEVPARSTVFAFVSLSTLFYVFSCT